MNAAANKLKVPYYAQTLEFTCGPACLMMALKYFHPETILNRKLELTLWREATQVFMTRGLGGCGPFGMAAAAARRGLKALVVCSRNTTPFLATVRTPEKREVVRLVHEQFVDESDRLGVERRYGNFGVDLVRTLIERGSVPIALISLYRLYGSKEPHWVVVTGCDDTNVFFHDPYAPREGLGGGRSVPVGVREFASMRSYGKDLSKMIIALSERPIALSANALSGSVPRRRRPRV